MVVDHHTILSEVSPSDKYTTDESSLHQYKIFIQDLLVKIKRTSEVPNLKIGDLASNTGLSLDIIREYLETIKLTFELYHALKTVTPKKNPAIKISLKQLQTLSDFYYISSKFPLPDLSTNENFSSLTKFFPLFFTHSEKGWQTSSLGQSIAQQILAFQRLNTYPDNIQFDELDLRIHDL